MVDPYSELDCEVVWHPSFSAPTEGDFDLCVHKGNVQRLHCVAKVYLRKIPDMWSGFVIRSAVVAKELVFPPEADAPSSSDPQRRQ